MIATTRSNRSQIIAAVRAATPIVADVELAPAPDGWSARLWLDPVAVAARAGQQGLRDRSLRAAAESPRMQAAIAGYIADVNRTLEPAQQIVRHEIVS